MPVPLRMIRQSRREIEVRVPIGAVLPYAGPINRCTRAQLALRGWLFCDGSLVRRIDYPALYQVIRQLYGTPPSSHPGWFYLPDYRGVMLRGVNQDATSWDGSKGTRDPDAAQRLAANAATDTGNSGNAVGSRQLDAFQDHEHDYQQLSTALPPTASSGDPLTLGLITAQTSRIVAPSTQARTPSVTGETRPANVYVNFIIQARSRTGRPRGGPAWCQDVSDRTTQNAASPPQEESP